MSEKSQSLFSLESFTSHLGLNLDWKINCDALTDDDLRCLAFVIKEHFGSIGRVVGIPRGGIRLANILQEHLNPTDCGITLIVDDVLTTGASMEKKRYVHNPYAEGVVIFARGPCPDWVWPVFSYEEQTS